eukprot:TRINITY_DN20416_c0_g1_i1.p1 TRINITY_DN20416_c0_g1~~TRINITY_DN20416_c0_g1_i1.p1  ORF type:complete len:265 (-),score=113.20 TRINITY_DN20416_c0_g1_i1:8-733(-)
MRVLLIHGYTQNAVKFRGMTGALRRVLKSKCGAEDFVFAEAPFALPDERQDEVKEDADENKKSKKRLSWWITKDLPADQQSQQSKQSKGDATVLKQYQGWDAGVVAIAKLFREQGPFDAVVGFSQGACVAGVLSAINRNARNPALADDKRFDDIRFKAAVMIGGFIPRDVQLHKLFDAEQPISTPTLTVYGKNDTAVQPASSIALSKCFETSHTFVHDGGHFVPTNAAAAAAYAEFFNDSL